MEKKNTKYISYRLQFIDTARFMTGLLSNLVKDVFEGIHKINWKHGDNDKKVKLAKLHISIMTLFLNKQILKI